MEDHFSRLKAAVVDNDLKTLRSIFRDEHNRLVRNRLWEIAHIAAAQGHQSILQFIVEVESSVLDKENADGETAAHIAAKNGHLDILSYLVTRRPLLLGKKNNNGDTVAIVAARNGYPEIVRYTVKQNPSTLEIKDIHNNSLLHVLAMKDDDEKKMLRTLKFLVEEQSIGNGISPAECNDDGETVLHVAAKHNNLDIIRYIAEREPSVLMKTNNLGENIAHVAAKYGYLDTVISYLANTNSSILAKTDLQNNTYFNLAVMKEHMDERLLKFLIKDNDGALTRGLPIAQLATSLGNSQALNYILDKNRSILDEDSGVALAHTAAKYGKVFVLEGLISKKPTIFTQNVNILFELPDEKDIIKAIDYVEEICNNMKITNWNRQHFLNATIDVAVRTGCLNILKHLIEREKIDVNLITCHEESPIFTAVRYTHLHILKYLVEEKNADLTAMNSENCNILYICVEESDIVTMKYVLDDRRAQIDINWHNKYGDTLLHTAVKKAVIWNDIEVLEYLVEQKRANINAVGPQRRTPLHYVAPNLHSRIFDYLVDHGADPRLKDENGSDFWEITRSSTLFLQPARNRRNIRSSYFIDEKRVIQPTRSESVSFIRRNPFALNNFLGGKSTSFTSINSSTHPLQNFLAIAGLIFHSSGWRSLSLANVSPTIVLDEKMDPIAVDAVSMRKFWDKGVVRV